MAQTSLPKTIRAILQPDVQETHLTMIESPVPTAKPNSTEHLIRVQCASPCNGELLWMKNFPPAGGSDKELVPCDDFAGTVITAPDTSPFRPGDEVYARTDYTRAGCARDYTIATTGELAHRSKRLSWAESAATPLSAETAWEALFVQSGIGSMNDTAAWKGKRVLVTAASGGVGCWVVQMARIAGAEVIGTCGPDNVALVHSLGASEVLNYRATDLRTWAESIDNSNVSNKVDVVIDCIGKKSLEDAWWTIRDGGVLLSIFQPPEQMKPAGWTGKDVKPIFFIMTPSGNELQEITKLVDKGKCRPIVDSVWPLEQYEEAFRRLASGHSRGKIILDLTLNN
jgi:NADPH:quinone reductase-like Zn-dependent oxidoreductase